MVKAHGLLVLVSWTHYCAYTSSLSTWWSTTDLQRDYSLGDLILGWASRLDAFSGYPHQTQLPSIATGVTTGTLEVCLSRSSRTKDSPPQVSCAYSR